MVSKYKYAYSRYFVPESFNEEEYTPSDVFGYICKHLRQGLRNRGEPTRGTQALVGGWLLIPEYA